MTIRLLKSGLDKLGDSNTESANRAGTDNIRLVGTRTNVLERFALGKPKRSTRLAEKAIAV